MYKHKFVIIKTIDGCKQEGDSNGDFHITPCLTYAGNSEEEGGFKTIALEWGYWAISVGIITLNIEGKKQYKYAKEKYRGIIFRGPNVVKED